MPRSSNVADSASNHDSCSKNMFAGFEHPTANFIYCPNQFFDVCLSNCSRNVVRLVAYFLFKTLGWLDRGGNPIQQNVSVSYCELITHAGVSRGAIRAAIDDAIAAGYIVCTRHGQPKSLGQAGQTATYKLQWDEHNQYTTDAKSFRGFYAGEGHRTPIPNAFFDRVLPQERLAVVKVVGTVLRHTIGYQNQFGGRRSAAPLSYSYIQRYAKLRDRSSISQAIKLAISKGYIQQISQGIVDPRATMRRAATYGVNWRTEVMTDTVSSRTKPAILDRFKNQTSNGSKNRPADRSRKQTKETTQEKDTYKQQPTRPAVVKNADAYQLLIDAGFDEHTASQLSESRGVVEIQNQIAWMKFRKADSNPLGLLRRAIEHAWTEPDSAKVQRKKHQHAEKERQKAEEKKLHDAEVTKAKQATRRRRRQALPVWHSLSAKERKTIEEHAYDRLRSNFDRKRFRNKENYRLNQSLDELCRRNAESGIASPSS
jgi:hypothetical protein